MHGVPAGSSGADCSPREARLGVTPSLLAPSLGRISFSSALTSSALDLGVGVQGGVQSARPCREGVQAFLLPLRCLEITFTGTTLVKDLV